MDQIKGLANKLGSSSSGGSSNNNAATGGNAGPAGGAAPAGNAGQEDYLDKGLDTAEKKFGYSGNRQTNEKATDFAREKFESTTGKNIPDKFSN